jgi:hypothetical protein
MGVKKYTTHSKEKKLNHDITFKKARKETYIWEKLKNKKAKNNIIMQIVPETYKHITANPRG